MTALPDVVVEIAFPDGYSTPAASRTWTDVSAYVELDQELTIGFGRADERSVADANTLSLTLDNRDGRFTAENPASPYYPNVKVGRPIRVTVTPAGGAASSRFVGYVDEWPVEWDGTDSYARAQITATSRLARMGLSTQLRSVVEEEILNIDPVAYYTLGEPEGATTAADSSGNGRPPLVQVGSGPPVTFGSATGPGTDDLTAATFAGGMFLAVDAALVPPLSEWTACLWFSTTGTSMAVATVGVDVIEIDGAGHLVVGGGGMVSDTAVNDEGVHFAAYRSAWNGANFTVSLWIDGSLDETTAFDVGSDQGAINALDVGGTRGAGWDPFVGSVAHVAVLPVAASDADLERLWLAGSEGFDDESTDLRLQRYARWARIPTAEIDPDTGSTVTMPHVDTTGQQVVEMLRLVETTEHGVLFDDRDGVLRLHNRGERYTATTGLTLSAASQQIQADYAPRLDRSALLNDVSVGNADETTQARVTDTDSSAEYGVFATSVETASSDPDEPLMLASWLVNAYAEPRVRVPSLSVDLLNCGEDPDTVLALTIGSLLEVTGLPTQAGVSSRSYFVEGYTETIGLESYVLSYNVSPTHPDQSVMVLDDPDRGLLDTATLAL